MSVKGYLGLEIEISARKNKGSVRKATVARNGTFPEGYSYNDTVQLPEKVKTIYICS